MAVEEQARILIGMAVCGAALGIAYDLLVLFRTGAALWAADLFFGILCAAVMVGAGLWFRADVFRLYTFSGVLLGMAAYGMTMGKIVRKVMRSVRKIRRKKKNMDGNLHADAGEA